MSDTATAPRDAPATADHSGSKRILALDGLRGLAVVVVVLYHAGHLEGGFLGVDLFFVLSGFLITTVLLRSWGKRHSVDYVSFWARRARRLLPAMLLMLAIVVPVYAVWFATSQELTTLRRDGFSTLLYVTNWQQIFNGQSYWANTLAESPLKHTWSLAVEEQFYFIWPFVAVALLRRKGVRGLRDGALVLSAVAMAITIWFATTGIFSLNSLYLGTHTRAAPLLAGAALAAVQWRRRHAEPRAEPALELAALASVLVLAWMWVTMSVADPDLYKWGLLVSAVCGTTLVAAASGRRPGPIVKVLEAAPLRFLGMISYGIYLWSWPVMQMIDERHTDLRGYPLLVVQLAVTMVAALASWYLVEKPILDGALPPPQSRHALIVAMAFVAVSIGVMTADATPIDQGSIDESGYALAEDPSATKLMVVGDSVPGVLTREGIAPLRDELGVSVVNRAIPGCILLREVGEVKGIEGNTREDVSPCNQSWAEDVAEFEPDVVLVMFGQFASDEVNLDGTYALPCDPAYQAAEQASLERGLDELTSGGARVVISTAPWSSVSWVVDRTPDLAEQMTCLNDLYREVAAERDDVDVVELAPYICPSPTDCLDAIDGQNLREDTIHFRDAGAQLVARWLVPQVLDGALAAPAPAPTPQPEPDRVQHPYCAQITTIVAGLTPPDPSGDAPTIDDTLEGLRATDPKAFLDGVPDELRPAIEAVTADWSDYLDRAASLSAAPTPEEVASTLGPYADPTNQILLWITGNC